MIRYFGYACINEHLKPRKFRTLRLKTFRNKGISYLKANIHHNLDFLLEILDWNESHNIHFYRVSSDILPLVTHPEVSAVFNWQDDIDILNKLSKIKEYVTLKQLRISMHPDQYTVLNAVNQSVYESALTNLEYHADFLTYIGGSDLILHVGGVYGDKASAMTRFVERYRVLPEKIKNLLRLENDDKSYTIHDVLAISEQTGVSVIFDFHHHRCHHEYPLDEKTIKRIMSSWIGIPKCHMSSGRSMDTDRAHHDYIQLNDLLEMEKLFKPYLYDLMIEAKKKEMALIELRSAYETQSISQ